MQHHEMANRPLTWIAVTATLLGAFILSGCEQEPPRASTPAAAPLQVSTLAVAPQRVTLSTRLPGRTSAFRVAEIRPQVNGLVVKRAFEEGSDVEAGQVLYQIDPAPFRTALESAEASLRRAEASRPSVKAKAARYRNLLTEKAISQQDFDDADSALKQVEAEIAALKAQVETARINLGYTTITAPITGRIGKSSVTEGAIVTAYQSVALATIQQLDPIHVDVTQSTTELLRLRRRLEDGHLTREGDENTVKLFVEDGTPYPREGTLQFRDVSVDPTTGSVILRMVFPNPDGLLLPEMFVRAEVREGTNEAAILIPQQAVMRNTKGEPYAFTVDGGGKVSRRMLTLEREISNQWLVASGLAAGDQVVMEGLQALQRLRPGSDVTVEATPFEQTAQQ